MKLLVLDFDGVVSDSARESFEVALRTYRALGSESAFCDRGLEALYLSFLELMPLGNRSEDFAVALTALERGVGLEDQAGYDRFYASLDPETLRRFHGRFYEERRAFAAAEPDRWHSLLGPYRGVLDLLERRVGTCPYAIATAKDRRSVLALLDRYGAASLFARDRILDKETGVSKTAHHRWLSDQTGIAFGDMVFIDDKVNHLDDVAALGVRCILATWGYNGEREQRLAAARGHGVAQLDTLEAMLFDES